MEKERITINVDLKRERQNLSFDPLLLTYELDGGVQNTYRRRHIEHLVFADHELQGINPDTLSRDEKFNEGIRRELLLIKKVKDYGLSAEETEVFNKCIFMPGDTGFQLHKSAFVPTIVAQADDEQLRRWMPLIESGKMFGAYAQTEIGHGSHVRGLETIAEYDSRNENFILNSPRLSSMKWWPGNLGKTSNHVVLLAQLYTKGHHRGVYPFLVPIRHMETHMPLKGITVGDIGPTLAGDMNDNGFLILDNVSIPRTNMLMKYAQVRTDGTFVKPVNEKITYINMVGLRVSLVLRAARRLAIATTIATRYSYIRRQSELSPGAIESQIIDFKTQQHKIFPHIANAYAITIVGDKLKTLKNITTKEIEAGNYSRLPELHASAACLKACCLSTACKAMEVLRLACGGHGYSLASGLPQLFSATVGLVTAEGEVTVLYLQTAKFLMKQFSLSRKGKGLSNESFDYLSTNDFAPFEYREGDILTLLRAFEYRAAKKTERAALKLQTMKAKGLDYHDAWNMSTVDLVKATQAHSEYLIMKAFVDKVASLEVHSIVAMKFKVLCSVYGIFCILENKGDFLQYGFMKVTHVEYLQDALLTLYTDMRSDAVGFVDAFDFRDRHLDSVLGRYDGNVYEEMFKWAQQSSLNKTEVHESFHKYIKPFRDMATSKL